jgi:hypothetical protein
MPLASPRQFLDWYWYRSLRSYIRARVLGQVDLLMRPSRLEDAAYLTHSHGSACNFPPEL